MINAGKYKHNITIKKVVISEDGDGFKQKDYQTILTTKAYVRTTSGYTLLSSNTDFEKATTNFTIRYPKTEITRDMLVYFNDKEYTIEYLNNIDEKGIELEIQARLVQK